MRRRPAPRSTGAVAVSALLLLATGCSGPLTLDAPAVTGADATACRALVDALPEKVDGVARVEADAGDGYGAAWGDPAIELRCGVPVPDGLRRVSRGARPPTAWTGSSPSRSRPAGPRTS